jgi:hypothetical protein
MEWLHKPRLSMSASQSLERRPRANRAMSTFEYEGLKDSSPVIRNSYQIINSKSNVLWYLIQLAHTGIYRSSTGGPEGSIGQRYGRHCD